VSQVRGTCDERFEPLRRLLADFQAEGLDQGASFGAYLGGELVADLWAGHRDYEGELAWEQDTLVRVFSTSKTMLVPAVLMLVDRGLLDLDEPIAAHWPEFAQHGKGAITARQVLVHRSGLPGFGRPITVDELLDWDAMVGILEAAEPWYEPGTRTYYHATTFGYLLGELVRRLSGAPFEEFFARELGGPLDADFHFTLPPERLDQVAVLWPPPYQPEMAEERVLQEIDGLVWVTPDSFRVVAPATSGVGNGRSIARVMAMLANGGELDGRRYLSRAIIEEAATEQSHEEDHYIGPVRYGLGFGLDHEHFRASTPTTCHWGGYGGSLASYDLATGLAVGFAPNQLRLDDMPGLEVRVRRVIDRVGEVARTL